MTYLDELVDAFKREVTVPGAFSQEFPTATDDELAASLGDAFGHAQLDGFFPRSVLDVDAMEINPDLSVAGAALVVLYAGTRLIRQRLRNLGMNRRYKAGPTEYEVSVPASMLVQDLKDLQNRLSNLIAVSQDKNRPTAVFMLDNYAAVLTGWGGTGGYGFFPSELPVAGALPALATSTYGWS